MCGHDAEGDGEPQPRSLAGLLGREEWIEQPCPGRLRDAWTVVADRDADSLDIFEQLFVLGGACRAFRLHKRGRNPKMGRCLAIVAAKSLNGVDRQVEQHLLQLGPVEVNLGQRCRNIDGDLDAVGAEGVRLQLEDALDQDPDTGRPSLGRAGTGEVEQVLDDAAGSIGLLHEQPGVVLHILRQSCVTAEQLAEGDDCCQRIVQLVGHA